MIVSVVTPSYNCGPFLAECIESVLNQDYPEIEYIVMDAGSTDETPAILRRYEGRIDRVVAEPDAGQGQAINDGFASAKGEIFAFLNADDVYLPGAISTAVRFMSDHPQVAVVYGNAMHVDEAGREIAHYPTRDFDRDLLRRSCFICQPAAFIRAEAFRQAGGVNPKLHYALDYDLWLRLSDVHLFLHIEAGLAKSRVHTAAKSSDRPAFYHEVFDLLLARHAYVPYEWIQGYCSYLVDGKDQFFTQPRNSVLSVPLCLLMGGWINRRRVPSFFADWFAHRTIGSFLRKA